MDTTALIPAQAHNDGRLIALWLHGRPATTQTACRRDIDAFLAVVGKPIRALTLGDVQRYIDTISHLAPATQARYVKAIKSLFSFARELGYLSLDVARAAKTPKVKNTLGEQIISGADTIHMLKMETDPATGRCSGCCTRAVSGPPNCAAFAGAICTGATSPD